MANTTIRGKLVDDLTHGALSELRVEAWSKDRPDDGPLGEAVTEPDGSFRIPVEEGLSERGARVFFKVYRGDELVDDTSERVLWDKRHTKLVVPARVEDRVLQGRGARLAEVRGRVATDRGTAVAGAVVEVWDRNLTGATLLGSGATDADGNYAVLYEPGALKGKDLADVEVRVRDPQQRRDELARSAVAYQAPRAAVVDVRVDAGNVGRPAEYDRLLATAAPVLSDTALGDLDADGVAYLANRAGWDARAVAMAAQSAKLHQETGIPATHYYALLRSGLPGDPAALHRLSDEQVRSTLQQSIDLGVIPDTESVDATVDIHRRLAVETLKTFVPPGAVSSLDAMLAVRLDENERTTFVEAYRATAEEPSALWSALVDRGIDGAVVDRLRVDAKLGHLTRQNAPLVARVTERFDVTDASDLVGAELYKAEAWSELIGDDVPEGLTAQEYAEGLAAQVGRSYPTMVVADMVRRQEVRAGSEEAAGEVADFLAAHEGSRRIGREPIKTWPGFDGLSGRGRTAALAVERMSRLSPSNQAMVALSDAGLTSAYEIARIPEQAFMAKYGDAFPSTVEAELSYRKAAEVHSAGLNLATMWLSYLSMPNVYSLTGSLVKRLPRLADDVPAKATLEELFENLDYCACDHCKSVFGPAAYFVELLEFLDLDGLPHDRRNPVEVLFERRPDLQHLLLSCENTNVVLPYVDVVNEILEHYVVNDDLGDFAGFNMRTDSVSADLLADPEFVAAAAYDFTKTAVYPHTLPFDYPLAALRLLFQAWDTTLADALRVFGTAAAARREQLELNAGELDILTDVDSHPLPEYFGEPGNADIDALNDAVADGKTFSRRCGIQYTELAAVLGTRFISPGTVLLPRFLRLGVGLDRLQSWYEDDIDDAELQTPPFPADLDVDADYDGDILQWLRDNRELLMGLVTLAPVGDEQVPCDFATVELRYSLPDDTANRLQAITYHKLHRFIRLWRKLGWDIELVDRLLTAFLPVPSTSLTEADIDDAFKVALARTANLVRLLVSLKASPKKRPDWLGLWDEDIDLAVRQERLGQLLGNVAPADLESLSALTGLDPFADNMEANEPSLLRFVDTWKAVKASPLKAVDLDYLLRSRDPAGKLTPTQATLLGQAKALRDALTAVEADIGVPPPDADAAYAKAKLALVYDNAVVDRLFGLVSRSHVYEAPFDTDESSLPQKLVDADNRLGFDGFTRRLRYHGVLSEDDRDALVAAAGTLVLGDMDEVDSNAALNDYRADFTVALDAIRAAGDDDLQALDDDYPELRAAFDAVAGQPDPGMQARLLLDLLLPELRARLKATAVRTVLTGVLRVDRPVVDVLTEGPEVIHAHSDETIGVLDDLLGLEAAVAFDANGTFAFRLDPPATDEYVLFVAAPEGTSVTVDVDGTEVVPATVVPASGEVRAAAPVAFTAGMLPAVELTVADLPAEKAATLKWRTKGMAKADVPASRLYAQAGVDEAVASLVRLHKAARLQSALGLTPRELRHFAAVDGDVAGVLDDLDVDAAIGAGALHATWKKVARLLWFTRLKVATEPEADTWVGLLEDPGRTDAEGKPVLAAVGGWKPDDLEEVRTQFALSFAELADLDQLRRLVTALDLVGTTGRSAAEIAAWTVDNPDLALVTDIKAALKASVSEAAWRETLQSVNDPLRNLRRDALVAYILHHKPPTPAVVTADQLYEHFLVDVQMDACMQTSRIRLALSTVQLFVTRCLMNLEDEVSPSSINPDHWQWMKRYRVWEANRRVFVTPENWLEPELRDNKSPFFRELESELLKSDIDDQAAEDAYLDYLKKLDDVARLEIVGAYLEQRQAGNPDDDVLHVFGRTNGATRQYWYRRYDHDWTPWEKVSLDIKGDHVVPVVWKGRLFVFWLTTAVKAETADRGDTPETLGTRGWGARATVTGEIGVGWGEYHRGKWTSPKSTEAKQPLRITGLTQFDPDKIVVGARTAKPDDTVSERLVVTVLYVAQWHAFRLTFTSKNAPPIVEAASGFGFFGFIEDFESFNYDLFWDGQVDAALDANSLVVPTKELSVGIRQPAGASNETVRETLLTKSDRLWPGMRVRPILQPAENQWEAPWFYSDEHGTFFVAPDEFVREFVDVDEFFWPLKPFKPDIGKYTELYEQPVIPNPLDPVWNPNPLVEVVNPNFRVVLPVNSSFDFEGVAFDARGIATGVQQ